MFKKLFTPKKTDEEITMSLVVITYKTYTSFVKSYQEFLKEIDSDSKWKNVSIIGLNSLCMFLVSSQFLLHSSKNNKKDLVDSYTLSMKEKFRRDDPRFDDQFWSKFLPKYQTIFHELGKRFTTLLENQSNNVSEFTEYFTSEIFRTDDYMDKIVLESTYVLNMVDVKNYIQNELN